MDLFQAALNEVKVLAMLSHPNIIEYYQNFLEDKALMIVMEYAEGAIQIKPCSNAAHLTIIRFQAEPSSIICNRETVSYWKSRLLIGHEMNTAARVIVTCECFFK